MTAVTVSRPETSTLDPAKLASLDAPGRLAYALSAAGNVANAQRLLKLAGYPVSITGARNDDDAEEGLFAAHPVNVSAAGFSYSAHGSPGHERCCASRPRGVYQGTRLAGCLPYTHARVMTSKGRTSTPSYLMSKAIDGPCAVVAWEDIGSGRWAHELNMPTTADRRIRDAIDTAISYTAHDDAVPEVPAALTPASRTPDGRIPLHGLSRDIMPPGWLDQPPAPADDPARVAARRTKAEIAARRPKIALSWGASAAAPYCGALKVQSHVWELASGAREGKSTTVALQASIWGSPAPPPDAGVMTSWDATAKGPGRMLGMLGIFPSFMDETGTAEFEASEWGRLVYSVAQGASRLTADSRGPGIRKTPGWQGVLFISGNQTITANARNGRFAGIPARVITLTGPFTADGEEANELAAAVQADYGHDGPAIIAAVDVATMAAWQQSALAAIGAPSGGTLGTNATQLALAVAGAMALDLIHGTGGTLADAAIQAARDYLSTVAEPQSDREVFLDAIGQRLANNPGAWATPDQYKRWTELPGGIDPGLPRHGLAPGLDGLRDDEWVYVLGTTLDAIVKEHELSKYVMLSQLHALGELHVTDAWRKKGEWLAQGPRLPIGKGIRPRVYKVRFSAIPGTEDDDTPPAAAPEPPTPAEPENTTVQEPLPEPVDVFAGGWGPGTIGEAAHADGPAPEERTTVVPLPRVGHQADEHQADADPRPAWLAATWDRPDNREQFRTIRQRAALDRITGLLDSNPDITDKDAVSQLADSLHVLAELEGSGQDFGGPFLPAYRGKAAWLRPWKKGGLPLAVEVAAIIEGYNFERTDFTGPLTVFDRNGAWIGAIGTTLVAHAGLTHTGEMEPPASSTPPGYYQVNAYEWHETGMPSPLGNAKPGAKVWIAAPTMGLIRELTDAGRWPEADALDSWTGTPVRLDAWGRLIRELRRYALETHGYGSGAYQAAKDAVSKSVSMMNGTQADNTTRPVRVWTKCKNQRIDWRHQIITNSAVFTWRAMDRCRLLAAGNPELAPVGIRAKDELLIPTAAVGLVTTQPYPGGSRPPVRVDPTGIELGTFKVKGEETR